MAKDDSIIIQAETIMKGMKDSPYLEGCSKIVNLDINTKPGIVRIAPRMTKESGTTVTGFIKWAVKTPDGEIYAVDDTSNSDYYYKRSTSGTWSKSTSLTTAVSRGIGYLQDYIFRVYASGGNLRIDRYGPLSSPSTSTNWVTLAASTSDTDVPTFTSAQDVLYFGVNNIVYKLADATVATISNVLDIPVGENITGFAEIGNYLLIATDRGNIYPWDQVSSSFNFPIKTGRNSIEQIIAKDNLCYSLSGQIGDVLAGNLSQIEFIQTLVNFTEEPELTFASADLSSNGIAVLGDTILFGVGRTNGTTNGGNGVYFYKNKAWSLVTTSNGVSNDSTGCRIGVVIPLSSKEFIVSWKVGSTYGVDLYKTDNRWSSYSAYLETQMYLVGGVLLERGIQNMEIQLAKPLEANQGIKIEYRTNTSASYTEIDTFAYGAGTGADNDNLGAVDKIYWTPKITPCSQIQFKVSLTATSTNSATPELVYIKLW